MLTLLASKYFPSSFIQHWFWIFNNSLRRPKLAVISPGGVFVKNIRFVLAILFLEFLAVSLTTCEHVELTDISLTPGSLTTPSSTTSGNLTIPVGFNQQYTATGRFSDGTTRDLTTQVTWTSSNTSVATVNPSGLTTPVGPGVKPSQPPHRLITFPQDKPRGPRPFQWSRHYYP